jgi:hypothetical protein
VGSSRHCPSTRRSAFVTTGRRPDTSTDQSTVAASPSTSTRSTDSVSAIVAAPWATPDPA